jgi:hypothetical protein
VFELIKLRNVTTNTAIQEYSIDSGEVPLLVGVSGFWGLSLTISYRGLEPPLSEFEVIKLRNVTTNTAVQVLY